MSRRKTTEEFIKDAKRVHGDKYDYSLVGYVNNRVKVKIICPIHGEFEQRAGNHLRGQNCPWCNGGAKLTKERFIEKARETHGDKYDYNLVEYVNNKTKVKIICPTHGLFEQEANSHLQGHGCPECAEIIRDKKRISLSKDEFIKKVSKIHNNKYDYSLIEYKNNHTKVKIICPVHGVFEQNSGSHINGKGCPKCANERIKEKLSSSAKEFIEKANKIHNNKYDYSLVKYVNNKSKVKIICPIHGVFEQRPDGHLRGHGCFICNSSKGEERIRLFLEKENISFEREKRFEGCKYKRKLPFDFYLPEHNMLIEFDGRQHFYNEDYFGGLEGFKETQKRDEIKNEFAKKNGIKLVRIPYTKINEIEYILEEEINGIYKSGDIEIIKCED